MSSISSRKPARSSAGRAADRSSFDAGKRARPRSRFARVALWTSRMVGRPVSFIAAIVLVIGWALSGFVFGFTDTWQLVINTATTIATFLMVFLIQNAQNRDAEAIQIKLDELIIVTRAARNALVNAENLDEEELDDLRRAFGQLAERGDDSPLP